MGAARWAGDEGCITEVPNLVAEEADRDHSEDGAHEEEDDQRRRDWNQCCGAKRSKQIPMIKGEQPEYQSEF